MPLCCTVSHVYCADYRTDHATEGNYMMVQRFRVIFLVWWTEIAIINNYLSVILAWWRDDQTHSNCDNRKAKAHDVEDKRPFHLFSKTNTTFIKFHTNSVLIGKKLSIKSVTKSWEIKRRVVFVHTTGINGVCPAAIARVPHTIYWKERKKNLFVVCETG